MRRLAPAAWAFVALCLVPRSGQAQAVSLGDALGHQGGDPIEILIFTDLIGGMTPFRAKFKGSIVSEDTLNTASTKHDFELEDRGQRLDFFGPEFGVRWYPAAGLSVRGSVGASWVRLSTNPQYDPTTSAIAGQYLNGKSSTGFYNQFATFQRSPGFSANLGVDFEFLQLSRISAKAGLQLSYLSATAEWIQSQRFRQYSCG